MVKVGQLAFSSGQNNTVLDTKLPNFTTGGSNVLSDQAGGAITTGINNTFVGMLAGDLITTGTNNTVIGSGALGSADGGERENIAIGFGAAGGINNDSAIRNVFIGEYAGYGGTGALNYSVAIGYRALDSTGTSGDASGTVAIGYYAGADITSGIGNTVIGYQALDAEDDGDYNTALSDISKFSNRK